MLAVRRRCSVNCSTIQISGKLPESKRPNTGRNFSQYFPNFKIHKMIYTHAYHSLSFRLSNVVLFSLFKHSAMFIQIIQFSQLSQKRQIKDAKYFPIQRQTDYFDIIMNSNIQFRFLPKQANINLFSSHT